MDANSRLLIALAHHAHGPAADPKAIEVPGEVVPRM